MHSSRYGVGLVALMATLCVAAAQPTKSDSANDNWAQHGRTADEQRFSPLTTINKDNIQQLGLAWYLEFDTHRGQEATPLAIDGVIYVSTAWSKVYAVAAKTGKTLWQYDPKVPGSTAVKGCCDVVNRGVAYYQGRVYVGTLDGRLIALDAHTGKVKWSVLTVDPTKPYTITGAPRVVKGKVVIGNGGAEFGVRGYVTAYEAKSGKQAWRFYTVPGDPALPFENPILEHAATTWKGQWWKQGGGGTVWDSMSYDPELDLLYIGVGNGSPWNQQARSPGGGDNLFLSSIVALKPDTGQYVWHYQTTPGDSWDYTATQHMILADLLIEGRTRKVLMQAPKNGFFYVLDRATGELLSAEPYAVINWASGVDMKTGRPMVNPEANYGVTGKTWFAKPSPSGAHTWHPMSFNPATGWVYLPTMDMAFPFTPDRDYVARDMAVNVGVELTGRPLPKDPVIKKSILESIRGHLIAWDPIARKKMWDVVFPSAWNGGVLSTAGGVVFQGNAGGEFCAYDALTGNKLWSYATQDGIVAAPISFALEGEQYIAVVVGWGGIYPLIGEIAKKTQAVGHPGRLLVFKLGGSAHLPPDTVQATAPRQPPAQFADADTLSKGQKVFHRFCGACHGNAAISGGLLPDLRWSLINTSAQAWHSVVGDGALQSRGMAAFGTALTAEDIEAVRAYVVQRAHEDYIPAR